MKKIFFAFCFGIIFSLNAFSTEISNSIFDAKKVLYFDVTSTSTDHLPINHNQNLPENKKEETEKLENEELESKSKSHYIFCGCLNRYCAINIPSVYSLFQGNTNNLRFTINNFSILYCCFRF